MKVLILSCNTGGGHNSAAHAVEEVVKAHGDEAVVLDYLCLAGQKVSHAVGNTYIQLVKKAPLLFGLVYKIGLFVSKHISCSPVYYANSKMVKYLKAYLKEHPTDVIVMPHLYPAETLTYMKRHNIPLPPTVVVMTDYTCIPFWEETDCDYYVVPDPALTDSIVERGLPKEKLLPFGIPVSQRFYQPISKEEARKELHLDPSLPYILVAGGSMGAGNLLRFTKELARSCKKEHIIVIAGTNKSSRQKLQKTFSESNTVTILGYTDQMPLYLKACDLVFTKPGGLTSTEAAVYGTPMVHTRPIPGCETENRHFFVQNGMSVSALTPTLQIKKGLKLLRHPDRAHQMTLCQQKHIHQDAAEKLYQFLKTL